MLSYNLLTEYGISKGISELNLPLICSYNLISIWSQIIQLFLEFLNSLAQKWY